jgi:hypothetical protein
MAERTDIVDCSKGREAMDVLGSIVYMILAAIGSLTVASRGLVFCTVNDNGERKLPRPEKGPDISLSRILEQRIPTIFSNL